MGLLTCQTLCSKVPVLAKNINRYILYTGQVTHIMLVVIDFKNTKGQYVLASTHSKNDYKVVHRLHLTCSRTSHMKTSLNHNHNTSFQSSTVNHSNLADIVVPLLSPKLKSLMNHLCYLSIKSDAHIKKYNNI